MRNLRLTSEDVVKVITVVVMAVLIGSLVYGIITGGANTDYLS